MTNGNVNTSCSPDDGGVELAGIQVDEAEGNGDGKLSRHGQKDGQHLDVLVNRRRM